MPRAGSALAENEWEHWQVLSRLLRGRARSVGDDLLCTTPSRIRRAIELEAADTLLLKVNQVGTLSEALVRTEESEGFRYYENIHAHLLQSEPLVITPELGMRVVQILDFAGQSARAGHALKPRLP